MLNREYILEAIRPYLTKDKKLKESDFDKLFSKLTLKEQYQIIEILIDEDIDYVDDEDSLPVDQESIIDVLTEIEPGYVVETMRTTVAPKSTLGRDAKQLLGLKNEQLCALYQQGDSLALETLILKNEKFVYRDAVALSKQFRQDSLTIDDIVQYGNIGLIIAANRFDITQGFSFLTYADYWIRQSIARNIIDCAYLIRLPVHVMEKVRHCFGVRAAHPDFTGTELIEEIIASGNATSAEEVRHLLNLGDLYLKTTSLNVLVGEDEETELEEFIPADVSVEEIAEQTFLRESLENVLLTLTPREEKVLRLRFGLDDGIERTLEDVGKIFGVTRERIRQIEDKALRKLRHPSRAKYICDFYGCGTEKLLLESQPAEEQLLLMPEQQAKEPFDALNREFDKIQNVLDNLSVKEEAIFLLRSGIDSGRCVTPEEMESLYGITKTELHDVETKALLQMDSSLRKKFEAVLYGGKVKND